jgi:hypothetical protein
MIGPTRRWLAPRVKDLIAARIGLMPGARVGAPAWGPGSGAPNVEPRATAEPKAERFEHPVR